MRPALKNCLFAVTRPYILEVGRSVGKKIFFQKFKIITSFSSPIQVASFLSSTANSAILYCHIVCRLYGWNETP